MSEFPSDDLVDDDLTGLVNAWIDRVITPEETVALQERLKSDPAARLYCASRIRFDSELHEVVGPQERMEWVEVRRMVRSGTLGWEMRREQTLRFGPAVNDKRGGSWRWWALGLAFCGLFIAVFLTFRRPPPASAAPVLSPIILRNPGFEELDLSKAPVPLSNAIIDWEDYFKLIRSNVVEIERHSGGAIKAKGGKQVAMLIGSTFITQSLSRENKGPVLATPGMTLVLRGWAMHQQGMSPAKLQASLQFVAAAFPEMAQYEAAAGGVMLAGEGWQPFTIVLRVADDLRERDGIYSGRPSPPPRLDLTGRELTLSIKSPNPPQTIILLDELTILPGY